MMSWFTLSGSDVPLCGMETYEDSAEDKDFYLHKSEIKTAKANWMVVIM